MNQIGIDTSNSQLNDNAGSMLKKIGGRPANSRSILNPDRPRLWPSPARPSTGLMSQPLRSRRNLAETPFDKPPQSRIL